ncbi:hypothetical protein ACFXI8_07340 [Streptomyces niveus]|uniref:hypothetical protein n=1 Tax=Streptomyces niveus TaxID=193462 RepID=UPI0036BBA624
MGVGIGIGFRSGSGRLGARIGARAHLLFVRGPRVGRRGEQDSRHHPRQGGDAGAHAQGDEASPTPADGSGADVDE